MYLAIIASIAAYQVLLIFVHLAVYATLAVAFGIGGPALEYLFIVLAVTFLTATLLSFRFKNRAVRWFYTFAVYWFGLSHFLFVGGVIFYFAEKILFGYNIYLSPAIIGACAFGALFLLHLYGTLKSAAAEIVPVKVNLPNLPPAWKGKKIVFVSDLHLGNVRGSGFVGKVVSRITAQKPEVVLIGGDMYDGVKCDPQELIAPFKSLRAPQGTFFVTGNHDYIRDIELCLEAIRGAGIRVLRDEAVDLQGIQLVGVDYKTSEKKEDLRIILEKMPVDRTRPAVFLRHVPEFIPLAEEAGASLGLFGHTHNGQVFPMTLIVRQMYQGFAYGLKRFKNMAVYTSSGVGTWGPPLRLGTKSEIVVIEFA